MANSGLRFTRREGVGLALLFVIAAVFIVAIGMALGSSW